MIHFNSRSRSRPAASTTTSTCRARRLGGIAIAASGLQNRLAQSKVRSNQTLGVDCQPSARTEVENMAVVDVAMQRHNIPL